MAEAQGSPQGSQEDSPPVLASSVCVEEESTGDLANTLYLASETYVSQLINTVLLLMLFVEVAREGILLSLHTSIKNAVS